MTDLKIIHAALDARRLRDVYQVELRDEPGGLKIRIWDLADLPEDGTAITVLMHAVCDCLGIADRTRYTHGSRAGKGGIAVLTVPNETIVSVAARLRSNV